MPPVSVLRINQLPVATRMTCNVRSVETLDLDSLLNESITDLFLQRTSSEELWEYDYKDNLVA